LSSNLGKTMYGIYGFLKVGKMSVRRSNLQV
jgi:hypothetical protein